MKRRFSSEPPSLPTAPTTLAARRPSLSANQAAPKRTNIVRSPVRLGVFGPTGVVVSAATVGGSQTNKVKRIIH